MDPVETRLHALEQTSTGVQISLARVEEQIKNHADNAEKASITTLEAIRDLKDSIKPKPWWQSQTMPAFISTIIVTLSHVIVKKLGP